MAFYQWTLTGEAPTPQYWDGIGLLWKDNTLFQNMGWNPDFTPTTFSDFFSTDLSLPMAWNDMGEAAIPIRHCHLSFTGPDGACYIIGSDQYAGEPGYTGTAVTDRRQVWRTMTPDVLGSWVLVGLLPVDFGNRMFMGHAIIGDFIYFIGGQRSRNHSVDGGFGDIWRASFTAQLMDAVLVSDGHDFLAKNLSGACCARNGKIIVASGGKYDETFTDHTYDSETYEITIIEDPLGISVVQLGDVVEPSQYPVTIAFDNRVFRGFGVGILTTQNAPGQNTNKWEVLKRDGTWELSVNTITNPVNGVYNGPTIQPTHATAIVQVSPTKLVRVNGNGSRAVYEFEKVLEPNLFANTPECVVPRETISFADAGLTVDNTEIIYEAGNPFKSWKPERLINSVTGFTLGKGYIIYPKTDIDLSEFVIPPIG